MCRPRSRSTSISCGPGTLSQKSARIGWDSAFQGIAAAVWGIDFARALHGNLSAVLSNFGEEEVTRSSHLEKVCLIKDGVGRDNISDFTTNLIKKFLLIYTQEFALDHLKAGMRDVFHVPRVSFNYSTRSWVTGTYTLPSYKGEFVLLTPKDMLTKDETWINKQDMLSNFNRVVNSMPDQVLRAQLNDYLARQLPRRPSNKEFRQAVAQTIRHLPGYVDHFIRHKEERGDRAVSLSEQRVREVQDTFVTNTKTLIALLADVTEFYSVRGNTYEEARKRVQFLKDVIENKGGHRLFIGRDGTPIRRESDLQILYRLCWFATTVDVGREVNDGRGPVDFKISRGARDKTLVEFKLASNRKLKQNLKNQVPVYMKASDSQHSLKVILAFSDKEMEKVWRILSELKLSGNRDIVLIDADPESKPSGSRA